MKRLIFISKKHFYFLIVLMILSAGFGNIEAATGNFATPALSSNTINFSLAITPTVSIAASPSASICVGTSVTITATAGSTGGGAITYDFKVNGNSVQSSALNTYTSTTLVGGDAVSCEITVTGGTDLTDTTATSNTINITILPPFTAGAISNTGETICSGTIPTLTIGSTTDASGGDNSIVYQWQYSIDSTFSTGVTTISDSSTDPNSPPPPIRSGSVIGATYTPTQTLTQTTYYRRQAKDGSCNATFINSSEIWTVTVNLSPDLSNFATNASDACIGFASQVTISSTTLADGNYNVTYILSDANSGTVTKSVSFIGGSGTFNATQLNNLVLQQLQLLISKVVDVV